MPHLFTESALVQVPLPVQFSPVERTTGSAQTGDAGEQSEPMRLEAYVFAILSASAGAERGIQHIRFGPGLPDTLPAVRNAAGLSVGAFLGDFFRAHQAVGAAMEAWLSDALTAPSGPPDAFHAKLGENAPMLQATLAPLPEGSFALAMEFGRAEVAVDREAAAHAFADRLTGAANRLQLERRLDLALGEVRDEKTDCFVVMFLDLDRFKAVNDTLGHAVGDTLLQLVTKRLKGGLGVSDLLARMGGDEFAILLADGGDAEQTTKLAQRLIGLLQRPFLIEGQVVNIGASIGIAFAPGDGRNQADLLRRADLALYHAKYAGRGAAHCFEPFMEERAQQRRKLEQDLRRALLLRQFELHYQPQIDVEESRVTGLEGLLRWRHPQRGLLMPAEFLEIAEEIGLNDAIGDWVLRTVCKDAKDWPEGVTAAVNVSPRQFESTEFIGSVQRALAASGLPSHRLEVEVTEQVLLCEGATIRRTLDALRNAGVRVAMDSFGTGLASLSHLVNFPFDKIKIDRSLVGGGGSDEKGRAILSAVSALGQSLGITTLAAGVETTEHLAYVRRHGCQSVQGFYNSSVLQVKDLGTLRLAPFNVPAKRRMEATL